MKSEGIFPEVRGGSPASAGRIYPELHGRLGSAGGAVRRGGQDLRVPSGGNPLLPPEPMFIGRYSLLHTWFTSGKARGPVFWKSSPCRRELSPTWFSQVWKS